MKDFQYGVDGTVRRALWYLRCAVGFSLVFAGLWGLYSVWGAWTLLISPMSIIAFSLSAPRRWLKPVPGASTNTRSESESSV